MSTFQYVRGSIGVCLVCLAHRLAVVVVVVVAVKERKKKRRNPLKRTPVGVIREETCNLPPDGVRFISVCVLAEKLWRVLTRQLMSLFIDRRLPLFLFLTGVIQISFKKEEGKPKGGKKDEIKVTRVCVVLYRLSHWLF